MVLVCSIPWLCILKNGQKWPCLWGWESRKEWCHSQQTFLILMIWYPCHINFVMVSSLLLKCQGQPTIGPFAKLAFHCYSDSKDMNPKLKYRVSHIEMSDIKPAAWRGKSICNFYDIFLKALSERLVICISLSKFHNQFYMASTNVQPFWFCIQKYM